MTINKAWFKAHSTELGIAGAGSGLALLLYIRSKSSSSAASSTTPTTQTYLNPAATDDTGVTDLASQVGTLSGQVQDLVSGVAPNGGATGPNTPAIFVPPSGQTLSGSGYGGLPTAGSYAGPTYSAVSAAGAGAIQGSGGETFFEPTPGNFEAVTPTNVGSLAPGTPQYQENG